MSTPAPVTAARRSPARGATVVSIGAFSFGAALNLGAQRAQHEVLVALSAHAGLPDDRWLARACATLADPELACTSGDGWGPDGQPLTAPIRQDAALARRRPEWGYANGAGAFRAALWRERPFATGLPGAEDKEWALHWLDRGYECLIDPELAVAHDHTHEPLPAIYRRARREAQGSRPSWTAAPEPRRRSPATGGRTCASMTPPSGARLSPRRAARLLGDHAGRRRGARAPAHGL